MKIEDFKNISLPESEKKENITLFKNAQRPSAHRRVIQACVDIPISLFIRTVFAVCLFKFFVRNVSEETTKQIQMAAMYQNDKEALKIFIENNFHMYAIYSFLIAFILGSFYYILMVSLLKKGTVGMRVAKISLKTKEEKTKTQMFVACTGWYYLKIIYPFCTIIALWIFLSKGLNLAFFIFAIVGLAFSGVWTTVFGTQPLYEKFSGVKFINRQ